MCAKNEKELTILIQTVRIYNLVIGMEFSLEKCPSNEKRELTCDRGNRTTK